MDARTLRYETYARSTHVTGKLSWIHVLLFLAGYNISLRRAFRSMGRNNLWTWGLIPEIVRDDWRNIRCRDPNFHSYDDVKAPFYPRIVLRKLDTIWQDSDCYLFASDLCPCASDVTRFRSSTRLSFYCRTLHTFHRTLFRTSINATLHPPLTIYYLDFSYPLRPV